VHCKVGNLLLHHRVASHTETKSAKVQSSTPTFQINMPHHKRSSNRFLTVGLRCKKKLEEEKSLDVQYRMSKNANAVIGDLAKRFVDTVA
jgi:hypothetical protein